MATTKIPAFLSSKFAECATSAEKEEFIQRLNNWRSLEFTEALCEHYNKLLELSAIEDDRKTDFTTLFQSEYYSAGRKAERTLLRRLIKLFEG